MPRGLWWLVEIPALAAFLAVPALLLTYYDGLPARIAVHFGLYGQPDGWGDKAMLWVVAGACTFMFVLLSATPFYPQLINLPMERTPRRLEMAVKMVRIVKLEATVFMAGLTWMMIETARGNANGIGALLPIGFMICLFATLGAGFVMMGRDAA